MAAVAGRWGANLDLSVALVTDATDADENPEGASGDGDFAARLAHRKAQKNYGEKGKYGGVGGGGIRVRLNGDGRNSNGITSEPGKRNRR